MSRFLFVGSCNHRAEALRLALSSLPPAPLDTASSIEEANRLLTSGEYALAFWEEAFTDQVVIQTLRAGTAALPVVILLDSNDVTVGEQMLAAGAIDYLAPTEITAALVARIVRSAQAQRQSWLDLRAAEERHGIIMQISGEGLWRMEFVPPIDTTAPVNEQVKAMVERGRLVECNDAKAHIYACERASDIEGLWLRDSPPRVHEAATEFFTKFVHANYQVRDTEMLEFDLNGQEKHFTHNVTGIVQNGMLLSVWGAQSDVTSAKHSEALQTRLTSIIESAHDQIFTVSLDGVIQSWNKGAEEVLGYSADEIVGHSMQMVVPPEGMAQGKAILERIRRGERVPNYQVQRRHKDGTLRDMSVSASPYFDSRGRVLGMWGIGRDVTDVTRAQDEVRRSEKLYHALASNFPNGSVYLLDLEGRFMLAEGKGLDAIGLSREEVLGRTVSEVFGTSDLGVSLVGAYQKALQGEKTITELEINGFYRVLQIVPVHDEEGHGEVTHVLAMTQDITEQRQARLALERSEKLYQTLASNFPNGSVFLLDRDLRYVLAEGQGLDYLGVTKSEMIGRTITDVFAHIPDADPALSLYYQALVGQPCDAELIINGHYRWIHAVPIREDGRISGVMVMSQDISPLKSVEAELRASQEQLEVAVQSGRIALWEWNASAREHKSTSYYKHQLGYEEDGFDESHDAFLERLHPDDRERVLKYNAQLQQSTDTTFQDEFRLRHKDGSYRWILSQGTVYRDATGKVERMIGSHIDITNLKQDAEELMRSRGALQRANDELELRVEARTTELAQTNEALRIESIERKGAMLALEEAVSMIEQARDESERANQELRANETRLLYGNLIFNELTKLRVTHDSELEKALQSLTQAGSETLNVERCSVWLYNEDQTSLRCADLYQRSEQKHSQGAEMTASQYPDYFNALQKREPIIADDALSHPSMREFAVSYLAQFGISSMLVKPIFIGGQLVGVLCCGHVGEVRPWKVEDQVFARSLAGICSLVLESLERAKAEADMLHAKNEAELAREEAERANKAKSEFLSRMSHELRTPMNSILGFAQILEMTLTEERQANRVKLILKAGHHLLQLINEVLDMARVETGHLSLSPEPVLAERVITTAADMVRPLYEQNELQFELDLSGCSDIYVLADQQRLSQVLLNLLSNAGKYNRKGGNVSVQGSVVHGNMLRLSVSDTGFGISEKFLSKAFLPFERLGREGGSIEGTGLGLALSKHLVEAMGGQLGVNSEEGVGSTFWVELPLTANPLRRDNTEASRELETVLSSASEPTSEPIEQTHTILYIEDNMVNLKVMEHLLRNESNINLISAMQGQIGLDIARQHRPSLILLDLHLPDMDGDEVLRQLLTDSTLHDIPVVMLSADATPSQIAYLLAVGASEYLTKPLNLKLLMSVIRKFLTPSMALAQ